MDGGQADLREINGSLKKADKTIKYMDNMCFFIFQEMKTIFIYFYFLISLNEFLYKTEILFFK